MSRTAKLTAIAGTALICLMSEAIAAPPDHFTFQDAEFHPNQREGFEAAKAFVASELPQGIPMSEAIAKVEGARAACDTPTAPSAVVQCEYSILARPAEGGLGENVWTVRLTPGPGDKLQSAYVERSHMGMPGID
jgi:hypothetical protein